MSSTFPSGSHKPIVEPAALLYGAGDAADTALYEALTSDAADAKFTGQGFAILK